MTEDLSVLAAVPVFTQIDQDRLSRLAARSTLRTAAAGSVVASRGQPASHLIVVESGALTATHETADGRRLRLGEFAAPCAVDKAAVLDAGGYTATWMAATRARLRLIPARELHAIIDDVPAARRHVLAHLARQLRDQQAELVGAFFADAAARTAAWLVRAASRAGTRILLPGAQQGLAETIGATRVSVNRALQALARDGLVRIEPGVVVILAPELLARRAHGLGPGSPR